MKKKSVKSIAETLAALRAQGKLRENDAAFFAANDSLFKDLESRWGSGFAQWVVDGLGKNGQQQQ